MYYVFQRFMTGECVFGLFSVYCVCVLSQTADWFQPPSQQLIGWLLSVPVASSLQQSFYLSNVFQNGHNCFVAGGSWELGGGETHLHVAPEFRFFILTSKRKHKHSISSYRPSHPYFFSQILNLTSTFLDCLTL